METATTILLAILAKDKAGDPRPIRARVLPVEGCEDDEVAVA